MNATGNLKLEMDTIEHFYELNNENVVYQQDDLFPSAFPVMEEIRRQGKLCDVVLKVLFSTHLIYTC